MKIARLFGIDVVIDWSWLIIAALLTVNLTAVFAHWHPLWGLGSCFALACVAIVLFFASLVAHELAHSLVATGLGLEVTSIRLFLFGGVSNIDREPPSALGEFAMAVVGPLVSLGLGAALTLLALLLVPSVDLSNPTATLQRLGPTATLLVWLGPLNVGLGLFNLVPGFPLDGGRILRAIFWGLTKSLARATQIAASVGQIIGWSLAAMGVLRFFGIQILPLGQGPLDGLWLAFIGWFLASAAQQSVQAMRVEDALEGVPVARLMRRAGPLLSPDTSVRELVDDYIVPTGQNAFLVASDEAVLGIVSVDDVRKIPRRAWAEARVCDVMTPARDLIVAAPTDPALAALRKLGERGLDQLPVMADGRVVGMLDRQKLAQWLDLALANGSRRRLRPA